MREVNIIEKPVFIIGFYIIRASVMKELINFKFQLELLYIFSIVCDWSDVRVKICKLYFLLLSRDSSKAGTT